MVMSDFSPEVEIWPFRACSVHPDIIIGTVRSLWTWLWGRYHVQQNAFLVSLYFYFRFLFIVYFCMHVFFSCDATILVNKNVYTLVVIMTQM